MSTKRTAVTPYSPPDNLQGQTAAESYSAPARSAPTHSLSVRAGAALPSCGELERAIGQTLQKAYKEQLGHLPTRVSCHLFADKVSIWIENSLTPVENILPDAKHAQTVRDAIDRAMQKELSQVIEECLSVSVVTLISGTCYEQSCTSLTALLAKTPAVRNPEKIPKTEANRQANRKFVDKEATD